MSMCGGSRAGIEVQRRRADYAAWSDEFLEFDTAAHVIADGSPCRNVVGFRFNVCSL